MLKLLSFIILYMFLSCIFWDFVQQCVKKIDTRLLLRNSHMKSSIF